MSASEQGYEQDRKTIPAGEFKNRCLALMDEVNETGTEIVITKHGHPVSKLVPAKETTPQVWGRYKKQVQIIGDIVSPVLPDQDWDVFDNPERVISPDDPSLL